MQLKGVSKDDANKMHEDINTVFADDKFSGFKSLITKTPKKETEILLTKLTLGL